MQSSGSHLESCSIQDASSATAYKKTLPEIIRINQSLADKWIAAKRSGNNYKAVQREISMIFSSPACINASFLKKREIGVMIAMETDLKMAREIFEKLTKIKWISSMITTCLEESLLRTLPCRSPHQEALSVFLLLPECPVMHDSRNQGILVIEFAKAVCKMNNQSLEILKKLWTCLEASSLNRLVQMLKPAIISQVNNCMMPLNQNNVKALLETMKEIYKANKVKHQLPESTFNISELSNLLDFKADRKKLFFRDSNLSVFQMLAKEADLVFSDFPFIFDLLAKIKFMKADSEVKMEINATKSYMNNEPSTFVLRVTRQYLVKDAMRQLSQAETSNLRKPLVVEFINEIRPESGGVSAEFFHCIFEKMTSPEYGMFIYPESGPCMWFPANPKFEKKNYFLFGILCGLSLYNYNISNIPFPLALYKKLLDQKPSLEDLKELSFLLEKNLQEVLNYEGDDIEELHMHFSIYWDQSDVDLIPNGTSVLVNQTNKKDYVFRYVDYIFDVSVKTIYEEFQRGFYEVCSRDIVRYFQPEELLMAMTGSPDYNWKQFEENSVYEQGYHRSHPTILLFWKAFHKLTLDEKKRFLLFLTGRDRLYVRGLQPVGIVFRCPVTFTEEDYPRSLTCHNILDLPRYSTMDRMKKALEVAIKNNKGFVDPHRNHPFQEL